MPSLPLHEKCTACGACIAICPQKCLSFETDELDNCYPTVTCSDKCTNCNLCIKVCPIINENVLRTPLKAFAGWSTDSELRSKSASGGIASALYRFAKSKGYHCFGAIQNKNRDVVIQEYDDTSNERVYQNSKYVYSDIGAAMDKIKGYLTSKCKVLVVGLPCQIAGLKKYLNKNYDDLITIDLICHGVCSSVYLKQHIKNIEEKAGIVADNISFRDPAFNTENFHFTLTNHEGNTFYNKTVNEDDIYQIGYHKAITYRENCYHCVFANSKRIGDLTLGDYWRIGEFYPFSYSKHKVSLIYANTKHGLSILNDAIDAGGVFCVERPIEEAIKVQGQLNKPSMITKEHKTFVRLYKKKRNFEIAGKKAMRLYLIENRFGCHKLFKVYRKLRRAITGS